MKNNIVLERTEFGYHILINEKRWVALENASYYAKGRAHVHEPPYVLDEYYGDSLNDLNILWLK